MIESLIICATLCLEDPQPVDLTFQQYDEYLYPEEKGGDYLEGPLSSEWVNREEEKE